MSKTKDIQQDGQELQDVTPGTTDTLLNISLVLNEIRDLLQRKIGNTAEDTNEGTENKNYWKLAAKVIDRILLIVFAILFVGGTIIFFIIFATHG